MADTKTQLYLASKSPRRRQLLEQMGVNFAQINVDVLEDRLHQEKPQDYVSRIALEKARAGSRVTNLDKSIPILGADTIVVIDNQILGKPADFNDAIGVLTQLSGRTHKVLTAISVIHDKAWSSISETAVSFRDLSDSEIEAYCFSNEPWDKAGGYAIQGKAAIFVKEIKGSYSGVMGLPIFETAQCLQNTGLQILGTNDINMEIYE
ncbi:Septum formation protein Maf [hydrothermal vent metagenome]|uniref:Septum formation protein Maf n=1 Tax=hydrothermal vent metagenome TaxID=652676 RepID=A0A3B1A0J1_9ZZZZ